MIPNLYVRIRGRVQGPFDEERLRSLVRRGQISRIHEVSEDGARWIKAADYPDLFDGAPAAALASVGRTAAVATSGPTAPVGAPAPQSAAAGWFYVGPGGQEQGPLDLGALRAMFGAGKLIPETQVWTDGMPQWLPAKKVASLFPEGPSYASNTSDYPRGEAEKKLGNDLIRAAVGAQSWVLFIAVMVYIGAVGSFVGGLILIILGSKISNAGQVNSGLSAMISAAILTVGGILLNIYASRLSRFNVQRDEASLEAVMNALKSFWVYCGILLIIGLALVLIVAVALLSIAGGI